MKKQPLFKKVLSSIMVAIIVLGQFSGYHLVSKAETIIGGDDPLYISLSKTNENGNGYAFDMTEQGGQGKHIWNLMTATNADGTDLTNASNLYCIKAEYGDSWVNDPENPAKYNKNYPVPLTGETESSMANNVLLGEYKNELLWIIDNLYVVGESDAEDFNKYLQNAGIIYEEGYGYSYVPPVEFADTERDYTDFVSTDTFDETVEEEDLVAVQQAAIWYFTNYAGENGIYNKLHQTPWLQYTNKTLLEDETASNKYPLLSSEHTARAEHATILYNYLIDEAKAVAEELGNKEYQLKNSLVKLWISLAEDGTANAEQPIIEVHKIEEKSFDLSLRKAIVNVQYKDSEGNYQLKQMLNTSGQDANRDLNTIGSIKNIDKTNLNPTLTATQNEMTAKYNHRKDPVVVEKGDKITYSISIYNEGEEAGYANKIVDQLPGTWGTGLRLENNQTTVTSTTGNIYNVEYTTSTNTITLTMANNSPKNVLNGYDKETETLASETILLECQVMGKPDTANAKVLTNIAYIAEEYNSYFGTIVIKNNEAIQDRDSQTWNSPQANSLVTTDIGYIGNTNNNTDLSKNDTYYAGEQDDDDFEKVIILPKAFDIALRKNITKVNTQEINNRTPNIDTTKLADGEKATAEYEHRKDPVTVKEGDIVQYNISLYNEGSIAGVATIVKDQLPTGLKLKQDFFNKEGENYYVISTKGNVYKVSYDEQSNLVTFTLDEAKTQEVKLLAAHKVGQELDKDIITLQCVVECKADDNESTFLTNIAYIYEAEQEDGTIVTNQTIGSDADRDSQPHTHSNKTAEELKTIGNIGYIGHADNPSSLAQEKVHFAGEQDDDDFEKLVILPEVFDIALRKNITKVNTQEINNRAPDIDTTNLDNGTEKTSEYKHRKDAVVVKNGDIVEYNISLYNEGSIAGVATIVKDQLPAGLKLNQNFFTKEGEKYYITSTKGNIYKVSYDEQSNLVIFTLDKTKTQEVKLLVAHEVGKELDEDIISLQCIVECKANNAESTFLTNIAYIYEAEQEDGTIVTNQVTGSDADRDSQPYTYSNKTANDLTTIGDEGYKGHKDNPANLAQEDIHFEGEQDDDDFEKLVILPEVFDMALRKNITKVNTKEINNRTPDIDITNLDNGTKKTAEYEHRKDAVVVSDGDIVEYNISLYNEGNIAGVATIVKDQLPTGLKLKQDFFTKEGENYYVTSTKGNVYKVSYDEQKNLVTFTLDETKTREVKVLKAHEVGQKLDSDIITLQCIVDYTADNLENTYFTNIAYIYEAKQEDGAIVTNQTTGQESDRDSQPYTYPNKTANDLTTIGSEGYKGHAENPSNLAQEDVHFAGEQDDDDFEKLVMLPKTFDLKLIKFITEINDEATGNRVLSIDTSKLNTNITETTAKYTLEKNPVSVKSGDFITYTLRIYNEGHYDGYATEISESIPDGLEFIVVTDGAIFSWDGKEQKDITKEIQASEMYDKIIEVNSNWGYSQGSKIITTRALSEDLIKGFGQEGAVYADTANKIDYKEVSVIFRVKEDVEPNKLIRNEAAISQDKAVDSDGEEIDVPDRDSLPGNTENEWKKENSEQTYDEDGKWPKYKEDDEDYDNIITKSFDLSLRKQIVKVNNALYTQRFSKLDTNGTYTNTIYDYYDVYSNKPKVKAGDIVVYSIRVYNEGDIDGYADLIVDTLPSGLEFVEYVPGDGSLNDEYGWKLVEGTTNVYQTDYLSYEKDENKGTEESTILKAYDGEGQAHYQEIYIECRVKQNVNKEDSLLNIAQIADDSDEDGKYIKDRDSVPGTSDDESKWKNEDDLDIEILELQEFDLSLRKFITEIENGENSKPIITRTPQVSYNKETEKLVYTHTKDALIVHVGETVIYTLRVYNEGDIDGYASEIKDNIPEYLEYLPEHGINKQYEWVMYDKEGNTTEDAEKAVYIKTEHLAKGKGVETIENSKETNLIKAFDKDAKLSETNPDYKEVKVAFKVKDPNSTEYQIINFAQISDDSDSEGKPIKDKDSIPDNGEKDPKEDDEDIEKVKVEYFDLSLLKYVTKVLVNENGQERVIETGNVGDENDIIPHVQINKKNINKTVVKFVYTIEIKNEGQIAGEATEITDYVPQGLVFMEEDNELWTDEGNNVISTKQLEGTVLQPGDTAQVEVTLRWINGENNLGAKTNIAEISEDHNESNVPDKDSTPDNKKEGEDDIDEATVLLSVNQGGGIQSIYINLIITFLAIILIGAILIKKFVL